MVGDPTLATIPSASKWTLVYRAVVPQLEVAPHGPGAPVSAEAERLLYYALVGRRGSRTP
jgi:hypothetical protein